MTEVRQSIAIDTNVLVYAEGQGDRARCETARRVLAGLPPQSVLLPVQVLGELARVLTQRFRLDAGEVRERVLSWVDAFRTADSTWPALQSALDLQAAHGLVTWDALILSVAAEQRCRLLLSEDFQPGFTWRGVTVVNPFDAVPHPLLRDALAAP